MNEGGLPQLIAEKKGSGMSEGLTQDKVGPHVQVWPLPTSLCSTTSWAVRFGSNTSPFILHALMTSS